MTIETRPVETQAPVKTVADVLRHAALIIEERGWTQWRGTPDAPDAQGRVCLVGAVDIASGDAFHGSDIAYSDVLAKATGTFAAMSWNDTPGRTASEVTAALRAAADAWEANR